MHRAVDGMLRAMEGSFREPPLAADERARFRVHAQRLLHRDFGVPPAVADEVIEAALLFVEEEHVYATELLPTIIATRDLALRDNFLASSGLDLGRVEDLETAYLREALGAAPARLAAR
jgi:uncharacterized protein (TIGR04442 family)